MKEERILLGRYHLLLLLLLLIASTHAGPFQTPLTPQHFREPRPRWAERSGLGRQLGGNSSSPVEPIAPLLALGEEESSGALPRPVFDPSTPTNVTAMIGNAAYLHCLVHHRGDKSVAWIRRRDVHILTVGRYTYTSDQRFEVLHSKGSNDWILKIQYAQVRDSGSYECQVSTKPVKSYVVQLEVLAPQARILGSPDLHVDKGSTISLTCVIGVSPEPPTYIFWYRDDKVLNHRSQCHNATNRTDEVRPTRSCLEIQMARGSDAGMYTCRPSNAAPAHIHVHVLNGETPAGWQTNSGFTRSGSGALVLLAALVSWLALTPPTLDPP